MEKIVEAIRQQWPDKLREEEEEEKEDEIFQSSASNFVLTKVKLKSNMQIERRKKPGKTRNHQLRFI